MEMKIQVHQALMTCGGATESIFPQVEAWLLGENTDRQKALEYVASRKNMRRYQSVIDFLFCEIFIEHQGGCFKYYAGNGPKLKDIITAEQLVSYNEKLLSALEIAYGAYKEKRRLSWTKFRCEVFRTAA
ncbi:MAG: hypothetical protein Q8Q37_02710 [bacterium]|nr:hypothetical protein [bacterium]